MRCSAWICHSVSNIYVRTNKPYYHSANTQLKVIVLWKLFSSSLHSLTQSYPREVETESFEGGENLFVPHSHKRIFCSVSEVNIEKQCLVAFRYIEMECLSMLAVWALMPEPPSLGLNSFSSLFFQYISVRSLELRYQSYEEHVWRPDIIVLLVFKLFDLVLVWVAGLLDNLAHGGEHRYIQVL